MKNVLGYMFKEKDSTAQEVLLLSLRGDPGLSLAIFICLSSAKPITTFSIFPPVNCARALYSSLTGDTGELCYLYSYIYVFIIL
jgi:hypothetical protein